MYLVGDVFIFSFDKSITNFSEYIPRKFIRFFAKVLISSKNYSAGEYLLIKPSKTKCQSNTNITHITPHGHSKIWFKSASMCMVCRMICHKKCVEKCIMETKCTQKAVYNGLKLS